MTIVSEHVSLAIPPYRRIRSTLGTPGLIPSEPDPSEPHNFIPDRLEDISALPHPYVVPNSLVRHAPISPVKHATRLWVAR
jgi:hypothetical protein